MACLNDIVGILDMDGFFINKEFYCNELGLLKVGDTTARSARLFSTLVYSGVTCLQKTRRRVNI